MGEENGKTFSYGDYIVIQRNSFFKIHQLSNKNKEVMMGKDKIELSSVIGKKNWSYFRLDPLKESFRAFSASLTEKSECMVESLLNGESGADNRNIIDDGQSQNLSTDDILQLRDQGLSGKNIVSTLIENSKTFKSKTEFSQEKYLKKKQKKYFEFITVRRPTLRLISEIFYNKDPLKVLGLRYDTLSQIVTATNIQPGGTYILHENGTQSLVGAALLQFLSEDGQLINLTLGNQAQRQAILAMNFTSDTMERLIDVKIYDVVRHFDPDTGVTACSTEKDVEELPDIALKKRKHLETSEERIVKRQKLEEKVTKVCELLERKVDGLVIASKEFSLPLILFLLKFIKPSRPLIVYANTREHLIELYLELRKKKEVLGPQISECWLRKFQVLPDRTHPEVNMSPSGGYILNATSVEPSEGETQQPAVDPDL